MNIPISPVFVGELLCIKVYSGRKVFRFEFSFVSDIAIISGILPSTDNSSSSFSKFLFKLLVLICNIQKSVLLAYRFWKSGVHM